MENLDSVPDLRMSEPFIGAPSNLYARFKQYRIISLILFLLTIISIALLMCSIFYGFGCEDLSTTMKKEIPTMKFLHVSDMHLDLYYNKSTSTKSFCRSIPNTLNITPSLAPFEGPYGRVSCDSPLDLVQSSLNYMKSLSDDQNEIKFFILSGEV